MTLDLKALAATLGGEVRGNHVLAPGPGHSSEDRSLSIKEDPSAPDGFIVNSFAGDDFQEARDHVKAHIGGGFTPPPREHRQPADGWRPVTPVPDDTPELPAALIERVCPDGHRFTGGWDYRDATGRLHFVVVRFDGAAGKQIRPFSFCRGPGGAWEWRCKGVEEGRVLYRLDRLAARPDAPVLVVEGERTADRAAERLAEYGYVVVTSSSGSRAAAKTDWSPLAGRHVTIWPDADDPGMRYADNIAEMAHRAGAASVRVVKLPAGLPEGWDLADDLPEGVEWADVEAALADATDAPGGGSRHRHADPWPACPTPIGSSLPPVLPFIRELLPPAIGDYVMDVADRQQAPPDFAAVTALCGIAAVVGNRVRIAPKQQDDWEVVPNLWGAIIGRPSAMKSPAMQAALAPVYAIQDRLRKTWEDAAKEARLDAALAAIDGKDAKKRAGQAVKAGDRDTARTILAGLEAGDEEAASCPRMLVNDATVEKLGELLNENPRGLLLVRDELPGFLARMEREEYQGERAFYLEAFNGDGRFTYDRIGRGTVHIANCTLSLIGGVQPSRIAPIVRGALTGTSNDGLIQRLQLAVWPDDIGTWTWTDRHPSREARDRYQAVFDTLAGDLPGTTEHPLVMRFSAVAQGIYREWMEEIQAEARSGGLPSTLESHLLKMPKTVASLALLFELVGGGGAEVGETAICRALGWAEYLRSHAGRLYASGSTTIEDGARLILDRRAQLPVPFTVRDVQRKAWAGIADRDTAAAAIDLLVATNHCREMARPAGAEGGRPSVGYVWHPSLGS